MKVRWTPEAEEDRLAIWTYIAADDPASANRMDQLFSDAAIRLSDFPRKGRSGKVADTRELSIHRNYRLIYQVSPDAIAILAVVHAARHWPPQ